MDSGSSIKYIRLNMVSRCVIRSVPIANYGFQIGLCGLLVDVIAIHVMMKGGYKILIYFPCTGLLVSLPNN